MSMTPFLYAIFLLGLSSLATAANFTQVFQWDFFDYEWPSEASREQALKDGKFKLENIVPRYMAVHGSRIFISPEYYNTGIPVSLVSLPTSSATSVSPKLTAFPSWDMHGLGDCNKIEGARGMEVDSLGRLWVLDQGSDNCNAKLWTINLSNKDETKLIHRFPFLKWMHDLVLDETPNGTLAYISRWDEQYIGVFSLKRKESWIMDTPGIRAYSIAISPKMEPRQLYIGNFNSTELYSISVDAVRNGTLTAQPNLIGNWTGISSYRTLMDNHGTMYVAFLANKHTHIHFWNTSQPLEEQDFYEVAGLNIYWPFTFALDQNGTLWITEVDFLKRPRYRLLKVAVGAKSYIFDSTPERCSLSVPEEQESIILTEELDQCRMFNIILICSNVFTVILSSLIIHWLHLRQKRKKSLSKITNEAQQMSVLRENQEVQNENSRIVAATSVLTGYDDEGLYDEVIYHRPPCTPPPVDPYEKPICHSPCCVKKVKSMPVRPRTFEEFGEAPHAPVEYDDVGPAEPEEQDDYVAPAPPITPHCEETTSESAQYLKILS